MVQWPLKNSLEKHIQQTLKNVFKAPPKRRLKKVVAGMDFEVWRQRCPKGGPKGYPRDLPGSKLIPKCTKMEVKMEARIA